MGDQQLAVWFLGRAGAGKTALARVLEAQLGFQLISGGNLLRRLADTGNGVNATKARHALDVGGTLPDRLILKLYAAALSQAENARCCLDGNPRNPDHFRRMCRLLQRFGYARSNLMVVYLRVSNREVRRRFRQRKICPRCSLQTVGVRCPICSAKTIQRGDDSQPSVIAERHRWFSEDVHPLLKTLKTTGALIEIDASLSFREVSRKVVMHVRNRMTTLRCNRVGAPSRKHHPTVGLIV
jgi:adenylate kinase family enzyme